MRHEPPNEKWVTTFEVHYTDGLIAALTKQSIERMIEKCLANVQKRAFIDGWFAAKKSKAREPKGKDFQILEKTEFLGG